MDKMTRWIDPWVSDFIFCSMQCNQIWMSLQFGGHSYFMDVLDITDCVSPSHVTVLDTCIMSDGSSWIHWRVTCLMNLEHTSALTEKVSTIKHCLTYLANIYLCKFHIHLCKLLQNDIKYQAHKLLLSLFSLFFKCLYLMENYIYTHIIITSAVNSPWYQGLSRNSAIHSPWYQGCPWNMSSTPKLIMGRIKGQGGIFRKEKNNYACQGQPYSSDIQHHCGKDNL